MTEPLMFGSWETRRWVGTVYMVGARCSRGCHRMQQIISLEELELSSILGYVEQRLRRSFAEVHS